MPKISQLRDKAFRGPFKNQLKLFSKLSAPSKKGLDGVVAVSYTHLTLPTKRIV